MIFVREKGNSVEQGVYLERAVLSLISPISALSSHVSKFLQLSMDLSHWNSDLYLDLAKWNEVKWWIDWISLRDHCATSSNLVIIRVYSLNDQAISRSACTSHNNWQWIRSELNLPLAPSERNPIRLCYQYEPSLITSLFWKLVCCTEVVPLELERRLSPKGAACRGQDDKIACYLIK